LWQPVTLENGSIRPHIDGIESGRIGMTSGVRPRTLFVCPKCGIGYRAICEQQHSEQSGRFDCIDCRVEVHSWSGMYDYTDWKAVMMKPMSPGEET
jgi:hypothetical protein